MQLGLFHYKAIDFSPTVKSSSKKLPILEKAAH